MSDSVLVLNQDYTPMTVCSMERAFLLVYLKKADLLSSAKDKVIRTVTVNFPYPSVIRINRYISIPYKGVVLTRHNVFKRDTYQCQYCGTTKDLTLDHLIPRSKGGKSTWTNLVTACKRCNARKGDFSLEESGLKLKIHPTKPSYVTFLMQNHGQIKEEWLPFLEPHVKTNTAV